MTTQSRQRIYDHRLVRLAQETGDAMIATAIRVPRSTVAGWLKRAPQTITTAPGMDTSEVELRVPVAKLEKRVARLTAILRIFFALSCLLQPDLTRLRVPQGCDKARLPRAIDRSRRVLGLRRVLRLMGHSPSRLSAWRRAALACELMQRRLERTRVWFNQERPHQGQRQRTPDEVYFARPEKKTRDITSGTLHVRLHDGDPRLPILRLATLRRSSDFGRATEPEVRQTIAEASTSLASSAHGRAGEAPSRPLAQEASPEERPDSHGSAMEKVEVPSRPRSARRGGSCPA